MELLLEGKFLAKRDNIIVISNTDDRDAVALQIITHTSLH